MKNKLLLLYLPVTLILVFGLFIPLIKMVIPTLFVEGSLSFANYAKIFGDDFSMKILYRTLSTSLITTFISIVLGLPTAFFITKSESKIKAVLTALVLFPLLTNSVIRSFIWINILGKHGTINEFLMAIKIIKEPLKLLYTDFSIIIGLTYLFLPLMIITLTGVLEHIDDEIILASNSLGASDYQTFFKVVLPIAVPGLVIGAILVFTGSFTACTTPALLGGNNSMVMSTFINQKALALGDWNGASVVSMIMIVVTLIVTVVFNMIASKLNRREVSNEG